MKKLSTFFLILFSFFSFSQNLVPNGSFEDTVACPTTISQITNAIGWSSYSITPDYFNACASTSTLVNVPSNVFGTQNAKTGNAYAGFITAENAREYIGIQLTDSLIIGQKYYASLYFSRAGNKLQSNRASNKLGIRLSTIPYSPTDNHSQVYTDSVITDTLNWTRVAGSFIADSNYKYLAIGNFFSEALTTYIKYDSSSLRAYYYVDDVILSPDTIIDGIETNNNQQIKIYPNPARDWITVEGRRIFKLSIFDNLGNVCFSTGASFSSLEKINISNLYAGIYFVRIETPQEIIIKKLIIL